MVFGVGTRRFKGTRLGVQQVAVFFAETSLLGLDENYPAPDLSGRPTAEPEATVRVRSVRVQCAPGHTSWPRGGSRRTG